MNEYQNLKREVIDPILTKHFFKKKNKIWIRNCEGGIVDIIEIGNQTIAINDFNLSVYFGIYYEGLMELLYGESFDAKGGIANCIFRGFMVKSTIKQFWVSKDFDSYEAFKYDLTYSLEKSIVPFLSKIKDGSDLLALFPEEVDVYINRDSILALSIGCVNFLLGKREKGKEIVARIIKNCERNKYEFAEKILLRMNVQ